MSLSTIWTFTLIPTGHDKHVHKPSARVTQGRKKGLSNVKRKNADMQQQKVVRMQQRRRKTYHDPKGKRLLAYFTVDPT